jgi:hypothetical protein
MVKDALFGGVEELATLAATTLAELQHYLLAPAKLIGSVFSLESPARCTLRKSYN